MDDIADRLEQILGSRIAGVLSELTGLALEKALLAVRVEIDGPHPPVENNEEERWLPAFHVPWQPDADNSFRDEEDRYDGLPYISVDFLVSYPLDDLNESGRSLESGLRDILESDPLIELGGQAYYIDSFDILSDPSPELLDAEEDIELSLSVLFGERAAPVTLFASNTVTGEDLLEIDVEDDMPESLRASAAFIISQKLSRLPHMPAIKINGNFPELNQRLEL